jgi:hypothetical protein
LFWYFSFLFLFFLFLMTTPKPLHRWCLIAFRTFLFHAFTYQGLYKRSYTLVWVTCRTPYKDTVPRRYAARITFPVIFSRLHCPYIAAMKQIHHLTHECRDVKNTRRVFWFHSRPSANTTMFY